MNDPILLICAVIGLASGILMISMPKWFKNLWKIRTTFENWGEKAATLYYLAFGIMAIATSIWLIIKLYFPLK